MTTAKAPPPPPPPPPLPPPALPHTLTPTTNKTQYSSVESIEGIRPEIQRAIAAAVDNTLTETDLGLPGKRVVRLVFFLFFFFVFGGWAFAEMCVPTQ